MKNISFFSKNWNPKKKKVKYWETQNICLLNDVKAELSWLLIMWSCQLLPTREETVIYRFSHSSQKSRWACWALLFQWCFHHLDAPITAARGPLDAYVFGRAVLCSRLQKSWRGWLRREKKNKTKTKTNHSDRAALILAASEDTAVTEFPMEANDSSERKVYSIETRSPEQWTGGLLSGTTVLEKDIPVPDIAFG